MPGDRAEVIREITYPGLVCEAEESEEKSLARKGNSTSGFAAGLKAAGVAGKKLVVPRGRFSNFPASQKAGEPPLDGLIIGVNAICRHK
jgi:hypothetical protein